MRLYSTIIRFLRIASHLYFVEVHASGRAHVPGQGPVLLAANHPGSILDSIVLSTQLPRPIHYLARSGLFRIPLLASLFRALGAIPIYRPHETRDHSTRNVEAFDKVYERFERGDCVGIFPEGRNSPWGQVGQLRKGAARMALGAEARNGYRLGLVIVPVGVNFENRELFMSDVLLRFGRPIRVAEYAGLHQSDPEAAVRALTADVQQALRRQALHIDDRRLEELVSDLADAFGFELGSNLQGERDRSESGTRPGPIRRWLWKLLVWYHRSSPASSAALETRLQGREHITEVLTRAQQRDPHAVAALRKQLERYKDHLDQTRLRQALSHSFDEPVRERLIRLRMTLYAVAMAVPAAFGLVHNLAPYLLTRLGARRFGDEAIRAFAYFGLGVLLFSATYGLFGFWLWRSTPISLPWTLAYLAVLPPTGFVALGYRRTILLYRDKILVRTFFWNRADLVELLRHERQALFNRFIVLAERFRAAPPNGSTSTGRESANQLD